jgi:hypothetical protein
MNRASVEAALVLEPPLSGVFEWSEDSRSLRFNRAIPFDSTTTHTAGIRGSALDAAGGSLDGNCNRVREATAADGPPEIEPVAPRLVAPHVGPLCSLEAACVRTEQIVQTVTRAP